MANLKITEKEGNPGEYDVEGPGGYSGVDCPGFKGWAVHGNVAWRPLER